MKYIILMPSMPFFISRNISTQKKALRDIEHVIMIHVQSLPKSKESIERIIILIIYLPSKKIRHKVM